jgi:hypothetical protein
MLTASLINLVLLHLSTKRIIVEILKALPTLTAVQLLATLVDRWGKSALLKLAMQRLRFERVQRLLAT